MTIISYAKPQHVRAKNAGSDTAGTTYSLKLENNSASPWNFYVYQQMPNQETANVFSTAWFCSPYMIVPKNHITFLWDIDYGFVWGDAGKVGPGVTFVAGGNAPADPQTANTTTFSTLPGPNLSAPTKGNPQGSLVIKDAPNVPNNKFAVGISMSGAGTFVTSAGPNLTHVLTPTPTYWIAAGTDVKVGTILDITTVTQNLQAIFPANVISLIYSLDETNTWVPA